MPHSPGLLLFFYSGKAPTRLFVVLVVPVKPFADEVANHTCCDSHKECSKYFHMNTSSRCRVSVGQHQNYITAFSTLLQLFRQLLQALSSVASYLPFSGLLLLSDIKYRLIDFEQNPNFCIKQQSYFYRNLILTPAPFVSSKKEPLKCKLRQRSSFALQIFINEISTVQFPICFLEHILRGP